MKENVDTLTRKFRALQLLLDREGRFVLFEDLIGASGALFRFYWPAELRERPGCAPGAASVCSGDPLGRAAAAYQYVLVPDEDGAAGAFSLMRVRDTATLEDRIVFFLDSLEEACRLHKEGEYVEGERYLSGRTAYEGMIRAVEREEDDSAGARRCTDELISMLPAIGEARRMLGRYLDRLGNFLGTGPAIEPFEREGGELLAARRIVNREGRLHSRIRRDVVKRLRNARKHYIKGFRVIQSALDEERRR